MAAYTGQSASMTKPALRVVEPPVLLESTKSAPLTGFPESAI